jgi:hypothetical protein
MTRSQWVNMIAIAESDDRVKVFGDTWRASGRFQMHMEWRSDYWPAWGWEVLALIDRWALEHFVLFHADGSKRTPVPARALADLYNLGHPAADPAYDARCLKALAVMGLSSAEFDTIVE